MSYPSRLVVLCTVGVLLLAPASVLAGKAEAPADAGPWMIKQLPTKVAGYERTATQIVQHESPVFTEVSATFTGKEGSSINVFLGDLAKEPELLKSFLKARGLAQVSVAAAANISIEAIQASDDSTMVVQDSPARIQLQESDVPEQLSNAPDLKISEQLSLDLRQSSGRGIIDTASPSETLLLQIPQMSSDKEQASPTGEMITVSAASIDATMNERTLTVSPQELQLSPTETEQSFIQPYKDLAHDIAGWRLYDANLQAGLLILSVADRYALLIEGDGIESLDLLEKVLSQIGIGTLEATATGKAEAMKKPHTTEKKEEQSR